MQQVHVSSVIMATLNSLKSTSPDLSASHASMIFCAFSLSLSSFFFRA